MDSTPLSLNDLTRLHVPPDLRHLPVDELAALAEPGWPRYHVLTGAGGRRPLPWVNGLNPVFYGSQGWLMMDPARVRAAAAGDLCFCCGLPLGRVRVMGRYAGALSALTGADGRPVWLTDGPPGHPRCVALAARTCPHLTRTGARTRTADGVVALVYDGAGPACLEVPRREGAGDVVQMLPRVVSPRARTLTRGELRDLAARDPLGAG